MAAARTMAWIAAAVLSGIAVAASPPKRDPASLTPRSAPPWEGTVATLLDLEEDFEGFPVGPLGGVNGWSCNGSGNCWITAVDPIGGGRSAAHVADGSGTVDFELISPIFGPAFGTLGLDLRRTAADSLYQVASLDVPTTVFNTRVNLETDGRVRVGQLDVDQQLFVFIDTGATWTPGVVHHLCIDVAPEGQLAVTWDGELVLLGMNGAHVAHAAGLIPNGPGDPAPTGHSAMLALCDNEGVGSPDGSGDRLVIDDVGHTCPGLPEPPCSADTDRNGIVDVVDLVNVVLDWGTDGAAHAGDVDGSGTTDVADLVAVILQWGPCPVSILNDACTAPQTIFFPGTVPLLVGGMLDGPPPACGGAAGGDAWFTYTAPFGGALTVAAEADGPIAIEVRDDGGPCGSLGPPLACADGASGGAVIDDLPVGPGATRLIRVLGSAGAAGTLTVGVHQPNDDCADAIPVGVPGLVLGSNVGAEDDPDAFTCGAPPVPAAGPGVWYHVVGTGKIITASLCDSAVPYDATLHVYCGGPSSCGDLDDPLLCAVADDDGCGMLGDGTVSIVAWCSAAGADYLVRVGGFDGALGSFELRLTDGVACSPATACTPSPYPANDDCIDAIPIADGLVPYDNAFATTDGPAHPACEVAGDGGATTEDIWYVYTAATDGTARFTTCEELGGGANHDSDLVAYGPLADPLDLQAACDPAMLDALRLACNDDDPLHPCGLPIGGYHSTLVIPIESGRAYLLRVGSWNTGNGGSGDLLVESWGPDDDLCAWATPLAPGQTVTVDTEDATVDPVPGCGDDPPTGPGRWLRIVGDGTVYTLELCNNPPVPDPNGFFDTRLSLYCGECDELACAVDDPIDNYLVCGPNETLSWCTAPGAVYHVLVHGAGQLTGSVDATLTGGPSCPTPVCP